MTSLQIEDFLDFIRFERDCADNTALAYKVDLHQLVRYLGDRVEWNTVTPARLAEYLASLRNRNYAPATIARKVAAIKSFFHYLVTKRIVGQNPAEQLYLPNFDKALPHTLTATQVELLLSQPTGESPQAIRDAAMLRLLYATGMRVSELMALDVGDVDCDAGHVTCGDPSHTRRLPIDRLTVQIVEEYLFQSRPELVRGLDHDGLFVNHRGERLTRQGFWLILKGYARRAQLPDVTPHTLRHSFALHALRNHATIREVQELLGHANAATTHLYTRLLPASA